MSHIQLFMFRNPSGKLELLVPQDFDTSILHPGFQAGVLYGSDPEAEEISSIRSDLHNRARRVVETWLAEQRFIPKFLISALAFGVMYFFMAIVVRDPIPFVDEFVAACLAGVISFVLLGRRDRNSILAAEMTGEVKSRVDSIRFQPHPSLAALEDSFTSLDGRKDESLDAARAELGRLLDTFEPGLADILRHWALDNVRVRLPGRRQLQGLLDNGISLQTWIQWCQTRRYSPWLGLLSLTGKKAGVQDPGRS